MAGDASRASVFYPEPPYTTQREDKGSLNMKHSMFSALAVCVLIGLAGCVSRHGRYLNGTCDGCAQPQEACQCSCEDPGNNCCECCEDPCRMARLRRCRGRCCEDNGGQYANPGPAVGAIAYPYYTVRGPRDFLVDNPPSIGPN